MTAKSEGIGGRTGPASPHYDHARNPWERDTTRGAPTGDFPSMAVDAPRTTLQPITCSVCGGQYGLVAADTPSVGECPKHRGWWGKMDEITDRNRRRFEATKAKYLAERKGATR